MDTEGIAPYYKVLNCVIRGMVRARNHFGGQPEKQNRIIPTRLDVENADAHSHAMIDRKRDELKGGDLELQTMSKP